MKQNSFLTYYKTILDKVSFDNVLLRKEYRKALDTLEPEDSEQLTNWLKERGLYAELMATQAVELGERPAY